MEKGFLAVFFGQTAMFNSLIMIMTLVDKYILFAVFSACMVLTFRREHYGFTLLPKFVLDHLLQEGAVVLQW